MPSGRQLATETPIRVLAVIVLYKCRPDESVSVRTLCASIAHLQSVKSRIGMLLYDNSPGDLTPEGVPDGAVYAAASANDGLSGAYNYALKLAVKDGYKWLLTLDQDTTLPLDFIARLMEILGTVERNCDICSVVPQIVGEGRMLSPNYFLFDAIPRFYKSGFRGIAPKPTYAFNSASTLRVSALSEVGGYSPLFWLDNSDAYIYHQLNQRGKRTFVAGDIRVEHEFSMFDIRNRVNAERYQNIVNAGCAFWDLELGTLAGLYHTASLVYRIYKHWRRGDDPAIRRITFEMLKRRVFRSKKSRIAEWRRAGGRRRETFS